MDKNTNIPSQEEVEAALNYIEKFEKGKVSMDLSKETNGGGSETPEKMKADMVEHIQKAKEIKEKLAKMESSKVEKPEGESDEKSEEEKEEIEKGKNKEKEEEIKKGFDVEELTKSITTGILTEVQNLLKGKDQEILQLKETVEKISHEPIKKSFTNLSTLERFQKAEEEGSIPLSRTLNKSRISDELLKIYDKSEDASQKEEVGNYITSYEAGNYLDPRAINLLKSKNITIID